MLVVEESQLLSDDGGHEAAPGSEPLTHTGHCSDQPVLTVSGQVVEVEVNLVLGHPGHDESLSGDEDLVSGPDGVQHC